MSRYHRGNRPLRLDEVSPEEMRELEWHVRQYWRKKREADALLTLRISTPPPAKARGGKEGAFLPRSRGGAPSDPTSATARRREKYLDDVRRIDRCCHLAAAEFCDAGNPARRLEKLLLEVVTGRQSALWACARCTVGRYRFYGMRRLFFQLLRAEMEEG